MLAADREKGKNDGSYDERLKSILLEPEQKELFEKLVEAARKVPRDKRQPFLHVRTTAQSYIKHPGLPENTHAQKGDIEVLARQGLTMILGRSRGSTTFDIEPLGFKYYDFVPRTRGATNTASQKPSVIDVPEVKSTHENRENMPESQREQADPQQPQDQEGNLPEGKFKDENRPREVFAKFLAEKKGYLGNSLKGEGSWQESGVLLYDIRLSDPESGRMLAVIEVNETKEGEPYVREKSELIERAKRLGVPLYVLVADTSNPDYDFGIRRLTEKGDLEQIAVENFPTYEDLRRKMGTKTDAFGSEGSDGGTLEATGSDNVKVEDSAAVEIIEKSKPEELSVARYAVGDSETEDDNLGFGPYVEAVAEFLVHEDTQPPLTMSVEGEWGSGKSSFMRQLQKEIRRIYTDQGKEKCFIVEFDPWRHDKDEALWAAFALRFVRQVSGKLGLCKRLFANTSLKFTQYNWREGWVDFLKVVGLLIVWLVVTGVLITLVRKGVLLDKDGNIELPGWIGSMAVLAGALLVALGKVKDLVGSPLAVDLKKYMKKPDYVSKTSFIEQFHEDFEKVVRTYAGNERVYVFVDDLDRCEVPKAAELMESINLMLSDNPKLVFIMGMDREKVAAGLAVKHEKLLPFLSGWATSRGESDKDEVKRKRGIRYGYSFIEKFIQIPFVLPIPTSKSIKKMLLEMAGKTEDVDKVAQNDEVKEPAETTGATEKTPDKPDENKDVMDDAEMTTQPPSEVKEDKEAARTARKEAREKVMLRFEGDNKNFRSVVLMVSEAFGNNPRRVKQFVNLFRLRVRTAASTGLITPEESQFTPVQLGKFVAIGLGWPLFIRDLERNPRLLDDLVDVAEGEKKPEAPVFMRDLEGNHRLLDVLVDVAERERNPEDPSFITDLKRNHRLLDKLVSTAKGEEKPEDPDSKIREWAEDERLIGLIKSGCFDENQERKTGDEYERFCMRGLDVGRLMKVAPQVKQMEME
jgi:hypothetical protein